MEFFLQRCAEYIKFFLHFALLFVAFVYTTINTFSTSTDDALVCVSVCVAVTSLMFNFHDSRSKRTPKLLFFSSKYVCKCVSHKHDHTSDAAVLCLGTKEIFCKKWKRNILMPIITEHGECDMRPLTMIPFISCISQWCQANGSIMCLSTCHPFALLAKTCEVGAYIMTSSTYL